MSLTWTPPAWSCVWRTERYSPIDCTAVENEVANSMYQRSELDWLIYNDPLAYAELILNGDMANYLKSVSYMKASVI